jgi:ABC-type lipoprotein export system ATPase subunit
MTTLTQSHPDSLDQHAAADPGKPMLRAVDLYKTYRMGRVKVPVLRGVSLDVHQGEWLAILGASGSGKSTLLHLMGGLDRPDRAGSERTESGGRVEFMSRSLSQQSAAERDAYRSRSVGFVFQFYHLLPELTVIENVLLASKVERGPLRTLSSQTQERARDLLARFGLGHRLRHKPSQLSGGERQRVAIARALINQPKILLADEPTGNLDQHTGAEIIDVLEELRLATGQTLVMVTHDPMLAARADRIVRLVDGKLAHPTPAAAQELPIPDSQGDSEVIEPEQNPQEPYG